MRRAERASLSVAISLAGWLLLSCAHQGQILPSVATMRILAPAAPTNLWHAKIGEWQARHDADMARQGLSPKDPTALGRAYEDFVRAARRQAAEQTVAWVQEQSRRFYRPDGDVDHWATLGEVITGDGDDCDGLDLLTFEMLRRLGFGEHEIYRAIVVEASTGQHHMVTLWFDGEDRSDPYLLDPTGIVTTRMVRMSEIPGWEPIQVFDERAHYAVEPATSIATSMAR
jgi:hypothetical protein